MKKEMMIAMLMMSGVLLQAKAQEAGAPETVIAGKGSDSYWSISGDFLRPDADDVWDTAAGVTLKYTKWTRPGAGYALSIGIQNWAANEEFSGFVEPVGGGVNLVFGGNLKGDATMIPIMAVGVYQYELSPTIDLHLEAGIGYVFVNSGMVFEDGVAAFDSRGNLIAFEGYEDDVDIEGNFMGNVAAELRYRARPDSKYTWFAGVGLQFDGIQGKTTISENPISYKLEYDTELQALFARIGVSSRF